MRLLLKKVRTCCVVGYAGGAEIEYSGWSPGEDSLPFCFGVLYSRWVRLVSGGKRVCLEERRWNEPCRG